MRLQRLPMTAPKLTNSSNRVPASRAGVAATPWCCVTWLEPPSRGTQGDRAPAWRDPGRSLAHRRSLRTDSLIARRQSPCLRTTSPAQASCITGGPRDVPRGGPPTALTLGENVNRSVRAQLQARHQFDDREFEDPKGPGVARAAGLVRRRSTACGAAFRDRTRQAPPPWAGIRPSVRTPGRTGGPTGARWDALREVPAWPSFGTPKERPEPKHYPWNDETPAITGVSCSGAKGDRTPDLLLAKQALSQLSYGPERRRV
jgi:hypothetical protein